MRLFRRGRKYEQDRLEHRLDMLSELTRDLEQPEFDKVIKALKSVFIARQELKGVKTYDEKENSDIYEAEKILTKETNK